MSNKMASWGSRHIAVNLYIYVRRPMTKSFVAVLLLTEQDHQSQNSPLSGSAPVFPRVGMPDILMTHRCEQLSRKEETHGISAFFTRLAFHAWMIWNDAIQWRLPAINPKTFSNFVDQTPNWQINKCEYFAIVAYIFLRELWTNIDVIIILGEISCTKYSNESIDRSIPYQSLILLRLYYAHNSNKRLRH